MTIRLAGSWKAERLVSWEAEKLNQTIWIDWTAENPLEQLERK
jgi:hypothetical protein